MRSSLGAQARLRSTYIHATLKSAFSRHTARCLKPLHNRGLASNRSPTPPIRKVFDHQDAPAQKVNQGFYDYYLNYKDSSRVLQLQPWISKLAPKLGVGNTD